MKKSLVITSSWFRTQLKISQFFFFALVVFPDEFVHGGARLQARISEGRKKVDIELAILDWILDLASDAIYCQFVISE